MGHLRANLAFSRISFSILGNLGNCSRIFLQISMQGMYSFALRQLKASRNPIDALLFWVSSQARWQWFAASMKACSCSFIRPSSSSAFPQLLFSLRILRRMSSALSYFWMAMKESAVSSHSCSSSSPNSKSQALLATILRKLLASVVFLPCSLARVRVSRAGRQSGRFFRIQTIRRATSSGCSLFEIKATSPSTALKRQLLARRDISLRKVSQTLMLSGSTVRRDSSPAEYIRSWSGLRQMSIRCTREASAHCPDFLALLNQASAALGARLYLLISPLQKHSPASLWLLALLSARARYSLALRMSLLRLKKSMSRARTEQLSGLSLRMRWYCWSAFQQLLELPLSSSSAIRQLATSFLGSSLVMTSSLLWHLSQSPVRKQMPASSSRMCTFSGNCLLASASRVSESSLFFSYFSVYSATLMNSVPRYSFSLVTSPPSALAASITSFCSLQALFISFLAWSLGVRSRGPCCFSSIWCSRTKPYTASFRFLRDLVVSLFMMTSTGSRSLASLKRLSIMQSLARSILRSTRSLLSVSFFQQNSIALWYSCEREQAWPSALMMLSFSVLSSWAFSKASAASSGSLIRSMASPSSLQFSREGFESMMSEQHLANCLRFFMLVRQTSASIFLPSTKQGEVGPTVLRIEIAFLMSPSSRAIEALASITDTSSLVPANSEMASFITALLSLPFFCAAYTLASSRKIAALSRSVNETILKLETTLTELSFTPGSPQACSMVACALSKSFMLNSISPFISMNSGFSRILKFFEIASCRASSALLCSPFLFRISACRMQASSFFESRASTLLIEDMASLWLPIASFALACSRWAGRNPGICLIIESSSRMPLPHCESLPPFCAPPSICPISTLWKQSSAMENKKSGFSLTQKLNPGARVLLRAICILRAASTCLRDCWCSSGEALLVTASRASKKAISGVRPTLTAISLRNSIWCQMSSTSLSRSLHSIMPATDSSLDSSRAAPSWYILQAEEYSPRISAIRASSFWKSALRGSLPLHRLTSFSQTERILGCRPQMRTKSCIAWNTSCAFWPSSFSASSPNSLILKKAESALPSRTSSSKTKNLRERRFWLSCAIMVEMDSLNCSHSFSIISSSHFSNSSGTNPGYSTVARFTTSSAVSTIDPRSVSFRCTCCALNFINECTLPTKISMLGETLSAPEQSCSYYWSAASSPWLQRQKAFASRYCTPPDSFSASRSLALRSSSTLTRNCTARDTALSLACLRSSRSRLRSPSRASLSTLCVLLWQTISATITAQEMSRFESSALSWLMASLTSWSMKQPQPFQKGKALSCSLRAASSQCRRRDCHRQLRMQWKVRLSAWLSSICLLLDIKLI